MYVDNEVTRLEKVIVHHPDEGISRISPRRAETLLFDDIVYYPLMSQEYEQFHGVLTSAIGEANVMETQDLIAEAIERMDDIERSVIDAVILYEELPRSFKKYFIDLSPQELSEVLITGYLEREDRILFDPIPNFMFTRDIAVTIKDHILITKASKEARERENLLTQLIFTYHPEMQEVHGNNRVIDMNDLERFPPSRMADTVSAEGGDIMMFGPEHLLIGCSERSTPYAFECIKSEIFKKELVKNVVQINIPNERSFMHIDTLFTPVDRDTIACHKPIVYDGEGSNVIVHNREGYTRTYASIKDFVHAEISKDMQWIYSGGGVSPYQEREQWTDSVNLVAIQPGVCISYDRNEKTLREFEKAGYQIVSSQDFISRAQSSPEYARSIEKTIITIPSAELSRARGGSHCMTCPITRAPY